MTDVTRILSAIVQGDPQAAAQLLPLVYDELRKLAAQRLAQEKPGQTLEATALVHEAYLRLVGERAQQWNSRGHFFGAAAEAMRRILVDNARRKQSQKRGGAGAPAQRARLDLDQLAATSERLDEVLDIDAALARLADADPQAADQLLPLVYAELRKLAAQRLAHERPGQTLQATALVHEAWLRLAGDDAAQQWNSRGHFFAAAAEAMRRILIEQARRKQRVRHGGGRQRIELDEVCPVVPPRSDDLLALDEALTRLAANDPIRAELVKLRFFAGLTMAEAAQALGISLATAERYWAFARVWLYAELADEQTPPAPEKNLPPR